MAARRWIGPFRDSFPDSRMEIADLVADGEKVTAHFRCSGRLWAAAGRSVECLTRLAGAVTGPAGLLLVTVPTFCLRTSAA